MGKASLFSSKSKLLLIFSLLFLLFFKGAFCEEKGSEVRLIDSWKSFFFAYQQLSQRYSPIEPRYSIQELEILAHELSLADTPDFYDSESGEDFSRITIAIHNANIHAAKALQALPNLELFQRECSLLIVCMNDYLVSTVESNRTYLFQIVGLLSIISILSLVFVFGGIAWVKNKKKVETLAEQFRQEHLVTATITKVQESERERISHDLHDTVTQDIRTSLMYVRELDNSEPLTEEQKAIVTKLRQIDEENMKNIRNIIRNLTPPEIEKSNFTTLLADFSSMVKESSGMVCKFYAQDSELYAKLTPDQKLHIFRIIQECVNNSVKHSGANEISIIVREEVEAADEEKSFPALGLPHYNRYLVFLISDDGCGIEASKNKKEAETMEKILEAGTHLGLEGMKSRASLLGAKLDIKSDSDVGTFVSLYVPM